MRGHHEAAYASLGFLIGTTDRWLCGGDRFDLQAPARLQQATADNGRRALVVAQMFDSHQDVRLIVPGIGQ